MDVVTQAWLFVRGGESIRIVCLRARSVLRVFGPGRAQQSYNFESDISLDEFLRSFQQHLSGVGWALHDASERRRYGEEPVGVDHTAASVVIGPFAGPGGSLSLALNDLPSP